MEEVVRGDSLWLWVSSCASSLSLSLSVGLRVTFLLGRVSVGGRLVRSGRCRCGPLLVGCRSVRVRPSLRASRRQLAQASAPPPAASCLAHPPPPDEPDRHDCHHRQHAREGDARHEQATGAHTPPRLPCARWRRSSSVPRRCARPLAAEWHWQQCDRSLASHRNDVAHDDGNDTRDAMFRSGPQQQRDDALGRYFADLSNR